MAGAIEKKTISASKKVEVEVDVEAEVEVVLGKVFLGIVFTVPCRIPFKWGVLLIHSFNASMSL